MRDGFVKVAAASPVIKVADCDYNARRVIETIRRADEQGVKILVFPELTLTGVSCMDLFKHRVILEGARAALDTVVEATKGVDMLVFVGLPLAEGAQIESAAAAVWNGELLSPCADGLYRHAALPELQVAVELGEERKALDRPAALYAAAGATVIAQMADFPATVSSARETELELRYESRRFRAGLVLAAPGKGESTTDRAWSGLCAVAENGEILAREEGADTLVVSEIDVEHLVNLRREAEDFAWDDEELSVTEWGGSLADTVLTRRFNKHPQLPEDPKDLPAYCERMIDLQVSGLVRRMEYARLDHCVVGISGGVDSTLAVMISALAVRRMGLPATSVIACTMPCFGTSSRTKSHAIVGAEQ